LFIAVRERKERRMPGRKLLLSGLAAALVASVAEAMLADIPPEILARKSELIVVAEVLEAGEPAQMEMKVPDSLKPVNAWFRKYTLRVTRVITEDGKPVARPAPRPAEREVEVLTRSPRPQQPGKPRVWVSDAYFASLAVGQSYVLILRRMPGRAEYYLPSHPKNCRPAQPSEIARVERVDAVGSAAVEIEVRKPTKRRGAAQR